MKFLITVDTELSVALHKSNTSLSKNVNRTLYGKAGDEITGVSWQMDQLETFGHKGIFFIDPMPSLIYGTGFLSDLSGEIVHRGHDVQLHVHTEWLEFTKESPVEGRIGKNIADFSLQDQIALISYGKETLERSAGVKVNAFRAGNFGANSVTLKALKFCGIAYDSSFNLAIKSTWDDNGALPDSLSPTLIEGVLEIPVSVMSDPFQLFRHAQVNNITAEELIQCMDFYRKQLSYAFVLVSHSFEFLSRDKQRANGLIMKRFSKMLESTGRDLNTFGTTFESIPENMNSSPSNIPVYHSRHWPYVKRMLTQSFSNLKFEGSLRPR
jgi:hypothetical protein